MSSSATTSPSASPSPSKSAKRSIVIEEVEDAIETVETTTAAADSEEIARDATAAKEEAVEEEEIIELPATAKKNDTAAAPATTKKPSSSASLAHYYMNIDQTIREDYEAAEAARQQKALEDSTTITLETIIKECEKQGYYRTPSCNEKLYLHHKGYSKVREGAFDPYTDVKVLWLEGNCFANENPKKKKTAQNVESSDGAADADAEKKKKDEESDEDRLPAPGADLTTALHSPHIFNSLHRTLRQFYLHGNLFMSTPRALAGFKVLDSVNLSDNFIEEIRFFANPKKMIVVDDGDDSKKKAIQMNQNTVPLPLPLGSDIISSSSDEEDNDGNGEESKKKKDAPSTAVAPPRPTAEDFNWIDDAQKHWDETINKILDGEDEEEEDSSSVANETKKIKAEDDANANNSPSKKAGVSKSEAGGSQSHLVLNSDNSSATCAGDDKKASSIEKRLKRFQKAVDYAVSLRSVPIPADGILRGKGADRWGAAAPSNPSEEEQNAENASPPTAAADVVVVDHVANQHFSDTVTWIQMKNNHLKQPRDLLQLLTFSNLTSLDLSNNRIENNDGEFVLFLQAMPQLKSLMLQGNPLVRQIVPQYRKQILKLLPNLMYLDDRPVFAEERRMINAWAAGGADGEKKERLLMKQEEDEKVQRRLAEFREIMRRGRQYRRQHGLLSGSDGGGNTTGDEFTGNGSENGATSDGVTGTGTYDGTGTGTASPSESESSSSGEDGSSSDAEGDQSPSEPMTVTVGSSSGRPANSRPRVLRANNNVGDNIGSTSNGTTFAGTGRIAANNTNTFYDRNYGPNASEPAHAHRSGNNHHADPNAGGYDDVDDGPSPSTASGDAPGSVAWGNYVIRDRNAPQSAQQRQQEARRNAAAAAQSNVNDDDDFGDVVI